MFVVLDGSTLLGLVARGSFALEREGGPTVAALAPIVLRGYATRPDSGFVAVELGGGEDRAAPAGRVGPEPHDVLVTETAASQVLDHCFCCRPGVDDSYLSS